MIKHDDFEGRAVFVTGGTSGIGLAIARAFGRAGAAVTIAARGAQAGEAALAALVAEGTRATFVAMDVRDEASVAAAVERAGAIDFAVNCAGAGGDMAPLERTDQRVWDDVMAINARGTWLAVR